VEADPAFQKPFFAAGYDLEKIGYFGESVLLPQFRGQGIGHRFFDLREQWALRHHFTIMTFCSVIRPIDHPACPKDYRPHDSFWNKRGYIQHDDLIADLDWPEVSDSDNSPNQGNATDTSHKLVFWLKSTS
jgi:GNAT superfamily N-acetyltransferase